MSNQIRSVSDLLELLADSRFTGLRAKDMRDLVVSTLGGKGYLYCKDASTAQTFTTTSDEKMTCWTGGDSGGAIIADVANNRLVARVKGQYEGAVSVSCSATGSPITTFRVFVMGTEDNFGASHTFDGTTTENINFDIPSISLNEGDYVEIYSQVDNTADTLTPIDAQFSLRLVG